MNRVGGVVLLEGSPEFDKNFDSLD
jgi:hypothetical protein